MTFRNCNLNMIKNMNSSYYMNSSSGCGDFMSSLLGGSNSIFNFFNTGFNPAGMAYSGVGSGFNVFGNSGCSLFTNCNGTINYDAMAGWGVANVLFGVAGAAISHSVAEKKANSAESLDKKADEIYEKLEAKKDDLKTESDNLKTLEEELPKLKDSAKTLATKVKASEDYLTNNKNAYDEAVKKATSDQTEEEKALVKKYEEEKSNLETLKKDKKAADEKVEAKEKEIKEKKELIEDLKADVEDLQARLNAAEANYEEKVLNKAAGRSWQQSSYDEIVAKFDESGKLKADSDITDNDIKGAISCFKTASNKEERIKYAKIFNQCWENLHGDDRTPTARQARAIIPNAKEVVKMEKELA